MRYNKMAIDQMKLVVYKVQDKVLNVIFAIVLHLINQWLTWKTHNIMFTIDCLKEYSRNYALALSLSLDDNTKMSLIDRMRNIGWFNMNTRCNEEK